MIQPSPSAIRPSGAICTLPSSFRVVTIVSRIMGMASRLKHASGGFALPLGDQRVADFFQPRLVVGGGVGCYAPIERLVLGVALGKAPGNLGAGKLGAEIEGMRAVLVDPELGIEIESVLSDVISVAIIDVDAMLGDLNAEVLVAHPACRLGDLLGALRKGPTRV